MNPSLIAVSALLAFMLAVIIVLIVLSLTQKTRHARKKKHIDEARDYLFGRYFDDEAMTYHGDTRFLLDQFINIEEQMVIEADVRERIIRDEFAESGFIAKQRKHLHAISKHRRKQAIHYIDALKRETDTPVFTSMLREETDEGVVYYLIRALRDRFDEATFALVMDKAEHMSVRFQQRLYALLRPVYATFRQRFEADVETMGFAEIHLAVKLAGVYPDDALNRIVVNVFDRIESDRCQFDDRRKAAVKREALHALSMMTPEHFRRDLCYRNDDPDVQAAAIRSFGTAATVEEVDRLLDLIGRTDRQTIIAEVLEEISIRCKVCFRRMIHRFELSQSDGVRDTIARGLSSRVREIASLFGTNREPLARMLFKRIIALGRVAVIITSLNRGEAVRARDFLLAELNHQAEDNDALKTELEHYLDESLLNQIGLKKIREERPRPRPKKGDTSKTIFLVFSLVFAVMLLPGVFLLARGVSAFADMGTFLTMFSRYVVEVMIVYFMLANGVYVILLWLAIVTAKQQRMLWSIKKRSVLFEDDLLAGITIIAPAYNEERSIVDSVTSLLNLKYPSYEVVVINDGSTDATLDVLIDRFDLERRMPETGMEINTKAVRGMYTSGAIPNLLVVDKDNGGKADALNVGVNVARHAYVCGIDADSILEGDSLLKLMSVTIDEHKPYVALGGNIRPANGCTVDHGKIESTGLSRQTLVRFQTLEYLRSFTGGRCGWAKLDSLLIISGAFGLFRRDVLVDVGGYSTSSTEMKKDTVGEDMELVVRMTRTRIRRHEPFKIGYVHDAECFTELPSDLGSLLKQRNRWQRGLIDILSYHRRIFFNPRYRHIAFFAFPYFYFFEVIGPFWEVFAVIALVYGLIAGVLTPAVILLFFGVSILFGMIISLMTLLVSEAETKYYTKKEMFILVILAILENFGYRQLIAWHRIAGFFRSLRDNQVWGKQKRQGFRQSD